MDENRPWPHPTRRHGRNRQEPADELEAMFRSHRDRVWRYVERRVPTDVVDDVVATTFATAWRRIDDVPTTEPERTAWLIRTAHLVTLNARRARWRTTELAARLGQELDTGTAAMDPHLSHELEPYLVEALEQLSSEDRYLLVAAVWEGTTAAELAVALGCSPGAARTRLSRARARLRVLIRRTGPGP
jgi:RNA polymerase sigma-70 factor (ECF subfamily)